MREKFNHLYLDSHERKLLIHKVLRWMMDNVYVRQDPAGNIKMDKEKSTEKIYGENRCSSSNRYGT